ncbi:hypothetical protein VTO42DRAFT_4542 [Malbranchea cinnamomea]
MHPPSLQLLRALRSCVSHTPTPHISSHFVTSASVQSRCHHKRRYLSTSVARYCPDDRSPRRPSPHHPSHAERPTHPPRPFDLSTADLKADLRERNRKAAVAASAASREGIEDGSSQQRTDLSTFDVFADVAAPSSAVDACLDDGFHLNNGMKIVGGTGCLLVDGEVFAWRPWEANSGGLSAMVNAKGQWEVPEEAWGVLKLVWPKPDLLILGLGWTIRPISLKTRRHINELGIRIEVLDTRNAAAQFNLLATERGVREVAAALIPAGWRG